VCLIFGISMLIFSTYVTLVNHFEEENNRTAISENIAMNNDDVDLVETVGESRK